MVTTDHGIRRDHEQTSRVSHFLLTHAAVYAADQALSSTGMSSPRASHSRLSEDRAGRSQLDRYERGASQPLSARHEDRASRSQLARYETERAGVSLLARYESGARRRGPVVLRSTPDRYERGASRMFGRAAGEDAPPTGNKQTQLGGGRTRRHRHGQWETAAGQSREEERSSGTGTVRCMK